ncbi:MAG: hypothetical protein P0Y53_24030 [Candidatus Pseudobacter hemicellulosilyticus]|uniref:DUF5018 domain-containing protein n=1 Tax=Candidatus Pseudobacter hemicellulosilyticus TaxID=3121375 RepID=A0AAJ5WWB2_9BACT|nr:MAG: hypothetical protein P0Y53_24030 [Pseudobacter sp.]
MPDSIAPVITVSEGATIVPASGAKVKFTDGVSYTVKAEDGTTRQYQLKVMVGGAKPVITDETPVTKRVGSNVSVSLENMRGDINENKLILVGENGSEYTLINRIIGAGFCSFIADTENGAGIPAGDYYLKAINRFDIPVTSKTKFIAISNDAPTPYAYFTHTDTIRVKAGETFSLPVRHAAATNTFSRVRCYYYEYGYITAMNFEVVGLTDNNTMLTLRVPEDALPMVAVSKEGIIMTSNNGTSYSQAMPFPIQVIP